MRRLIHDLLIQDLKRKMVLLSGPRQVGKSWLAKEIMLSSPRPVYLNYDDIDGRTIIEKRRWPSDTTLIVFDEIHKMPGWKNYLKGIYDTKPEEMSMLVTGSARLETFRHSGDSMAGRYYHRRLMPISPREAAAAGVERNLDHFLSRGGFPEPFLTADDADAGRWRRQYLDGLVREDILDFENIMGLKAMNLLVELLRGRVGSPINYQGLSEDLGIAPNTVKHYIEILEALCIVFRVYPHHRSIARSLVKQAKLYFYDTGLVKDRGARYENFIALSLATALMSLEDSDGRNRGLRYVRTRDGREVDFAVTVEDELKLLVEAKYSDPDPDPNLRYFVDRLDVQGLQLVGDLRLEYDDGRIQVRRSMDWLQTVADASMLS